MVQTTIKEDYDGIYQFLTNVRNLSSFQSHKNKHYLYNYCYLCYMAVRLIEMHRILKDTGSIYLHCDPTMSHYLKILMDLIFGEKNFRNEIVWGYQWGGAGKRDFSRKHDIILRFCKTSEWIFNSDAVRVPYNTDIEGRKTPLIVREKYEKGKISRDLWDDIGGISTVSKERVGYPTQKPLKLLERIVNTSSNEGDVVLDPFCGCATTCVASQKLGRKWIGIDVSHRAYELVKERLKREISDLFIDIEKDLNYSIIPPKRTDTNGEDNIVKKYVYIISNPKYKGEYKVGIAKDVHSRLNSYQTSDPDRNFKLEYKIHTHLFREIEKHIHEKFENKHEWVREKLENIIKEIENYK